LSLKQEAKSLCMAVIVACIIFLTGYYCGYCQSGLPDLRREKDRITQLYQRDEARIKQYQSTIAELTNKLTASAATINLLERAVSGANTAIGNATESVKRVEAIIGRVEKTIRGLPEGDKEP
jgi:septal ring factor EnvC (AmiA/AmiB activator)